MRKGIISAGNWLVDFVKIIEKYPAPGNLITIESTETGLGGCAHNVLVDLAHLHTDIPLYAAGCIGDDPNGEYVLNEIEKYNIDKSYMKIVPHTPTAYTDVMAEKGGRSRTYFHCRGANAQLDIEHIDTIDTNAKIFHLGYLLLLDKLDAEDPQYKVKAARILDKLQKKGYKTSVDVVSEESNRFSRIITPCLPFTDYLIINEVEAAQCTGIPTRTSQNTVIIENIKNAAQQLLDNGVKELVTIHFPEGGYAINKNGNSIFVPSFPIPPQHIVSTVGAGDAFCSGMLYAIHEEYSLKESLLFASACASFNLRNATCTGGAPTLDEVTKFLENHK